MPVPGAVNTGVERSEIMVYATSLMEERTLIAVSDLEKECFEHFKGRWKPAALWQMSSASGVKKDRRHWENQVDWVKATWTEKGETFKVNVDRVPHLLWVHRVGFIEGHGYVMSRDLFLKIYDKLWELINDSH